MNNIIPRHVDLGKASAEYDDEYFDSCFVDTGFLDRLLSSSSATSIVVGRTGSGKSALIRRIKETHGQVIEVNPEDLSLGYLADSWLLKFLTENEFELNLFYQQLWRHVLVIELLKHYEGLDNESKTKNFLNKIGGLFSDDSAKKKAMEYLNQYGGTFWSDTDERIKRITDEFERQVEGEAGSGFKTLAAKYRRGEKIGRHETKELVSNAQKIVNSVQMRELSRIIDILDEDIFTDKMRSVILVIDDLDHQWADDRVRMKLIEALINALPKFRKIRHVKIVVAMRDDLLDTVLRQASTAGFQRDKFDDHHTRVSWNKAELRKFIDARIGFLFRRKYTSENVGLNDIFSNQKGEEGSFNYIIDRTMLRPRDVLAYFNLLFDRFGGKATISLKDIRSVELDFSKSRRAALNGEWSESLPCIDDLLAFLGHRKMSAKFRLGAVDSDAVDHTVMQLYATYEKLEIPIVEFAKAAFDNNSEESRREFLYRLVALLYRVGVLGLRTQENSSWQFSFNSVPSISIDELGENTHCLVHPMLWQTFKRRAELGTLFDEY
ncbi:MAG: P-loop NTPase fold protein [Erythrobacter sp.]